MGTSSPTERKYFNIATGMRFNIHGAMLPPSSLFSSRRKGWIFFFFFYGSIELWAGFIAGFIALCEGCEEILEREIEFAPRVGKVKG